MGSTLPNTFSEAARPGAARGPLAETFAACASQGRAALVPFVSAGHPSPARTPEVLRMLAESGADVIELGVPFSDPLADGPVIQAASHSAILQGADLAWTLDALADFRARHATPVVLFSYLNPILRYGMERFLADAARAGAAGVLVTDLPVGSDPRLEQQFADSPLDLIRLIAPTTPPARVRTIADAARGFLYYISRTGVTGEHAALARGIGEEVAAVREVTPVPVAVGFGISTPEQAAVVAGLADGVVVGSALVRMLETGGIEEAARFVSRLRAAMQR
jgi:tryptophan synthase alpha chain